MRKTGVGLYGANGHQIHRELADHTDAGLVAVAGCAADFCPGAVHYATLDELLANTAVELVSLCSPRRADQAGDAIRCLRAGKHVYAEKPCALTEADLDAIIEAAQQTGRQFHEMAGTVVTQPYREMRRLIAEGAIGEVVQVLAQKSYPWRDSRPADEAVDGGLALQAGVYIARFVEHIAGQRIQSLDIAETSLGNPQSGSNCRMAVSFLMRLESGGLASGVCNYLNPIRERCWGYEILRVFGTRGIVESNADGPRARLLIEGRPPQDLDLSQPTENWFDLVIRALRGGPPLPLDMDDELRPTRWVVRAKNALTPSDI